MPRMRGGRAWLCCGAAVIGALAGCAPGRVLIDPSPLYPAWAECDLAAESAPCMEQGLLKADIALQNTFEKLRLANSGRERALIEQEQRMWLALRGRQCDVEIGDADGPQWAPSLAREQAKGPCVLVHTRLRESELRLFGGGSVGRTVSARGLRRHLYQIVSHETRAEGRWYFEVSIDATQLAFAMDALLFVGLEGEAGDAGRLVKVRPDGGSIRFLLLLPAPVTVGIAADLDGGQVYVRENGKWVTGAPGSGAGLGLKARSRVKGTLNSSVPINAAIDQGLVRLNFGTAPFSLPPPEGYAPWRSGAPKPGPGVQAPHVGSYATR